MKPSEKINEIMNFNEKGISKRNWSDAIIQYLDEQYEMNKTPEQRQRELDTIRSVQVPHIN